MKKAIHALLIVASLAMTANALAGPRFESVTVTGHHPGVAGASFTQTFTSAPVNVATPNSTRQFYSLGTWTDATLGINAVDTTSDQVMKKYASFSATYFYKSSDTALFGTWKAATVTPIEKKLFDTNGVPIPSAYKYNVKFSGNNLHIKGNTATGPSNTMDVIKIVTKDTATSANHTHYLAFSYNK